MKKSISFLIISIYTLTLIGQAIHLTPIHDSDHTNLVDESRVINWNSPEPTSWINYNPMYALTEEHFLDVSKKEASTGLSIFAVYQAFSSSKEQHLLSIYSEKQNLAVLSDQRMADLHNGKFANFLTYDPHEIKLTSFTKTSFPGDAYAIKFGGQAPKKNVPLVPGKAYIGDIIAYPNAVSPMTKEIIESTLALKYGIALSPALKYRDMNGKVLLDLSTSEFRYHVGGLGKISSLHFNQKQSLSSVEKGSFSIALDSLYKSNLVNPENVSNNKFLIWSDNGKSIQFQKNTSGNFLAERLWKIENTGISKESLFQLKIDEPLLTNQLQDQELIWIKLRSNDETVYYPLDDQGFSNKIHLAEGSHLMQILKAPKLWLAVETDNANCLDDGLGEARITLLGSLNNSNVIITDEAGQILAIENDLSNTVNLKSLPTGQYHISLFENGQQQLTQSFYINSQEIESINLPKTILVESRREKSFDASHFFNGSYSYMWTDENGKKYNGSAIEFEEEGIYKLTISSDVCQSVFFVHVVFPAEEFLSFIVYPNPSSTGHIWWEIEHENNREVSIEITDILGFPLFARTSQSSLFHSGHFYYSNNGTIIITAKAGKTIQSKKVIIQHLY